MTEWQVCRSPGRPRKRKPRQTGQWQQQCGAQWRVNMYSFSKTIEERGKLGQKGTAKRDLMDFLFDYGINQEFNWVTEHQSCLGIEKLRRQWFLFFGPSWKGCCLFIWKPNSRLSTIAALTRRATLVAFPPPLFLYSTWELDEGLWAETSLWFSGCTPLPVLSFYVHFYVNPPCLLRRVCFTNLLTYIHMLWK